MFRITRDPSVGIIDSYLIETTRNGSTVLVVRAAHTPQVLNMLPNTDSAHNKHC
jgi:transposase